MNAGNHYDIANLSNSIKIALVNAGLDLNQLSRKELSNFDEFHLQGSKISYELAEKLNLQAQMKVLDIGCGLGGPCRMLAEKYKVIATGIDYTPSYIEAAQMLSGLLGLDKNPEFIVGNALDLPFENESFDRVWTQHVQMNIEDKALFYNEIERVLKPEGIFVYYDIFGSRPSSPIHFPVPWAEAPENSHLIKPEQVNKYLDQKNWENIWQKDYSQIAQELLTQALENAQKGKTPKLGLNLLMGASTGQKLGNLLKCLNEGLVKVMAAIYQKHA